MTKYLKPGETEDNREALVAELGDPLQEDAYWRESYADRPYVEGASYEDFGPAYAYGVNSYHAHADHGHSFEDVEGDIGHGWDKAKGESTLTWERAKHAVKDAWERLTS
jgi:hypothetical protein